MAHLQNKIKNILCLNICKKNNNDKLKIFKNILKKVYDLNNFNYYDYDEIIDFDSYDI